jgi:hypothetical protein
LLQQVHALLREFQVQPQPRVGLLDQAQLIHFVGGEKVALRRRGHGGEQDNCGKSG